MTEQPNPITREPVRTRLIRATIRHTKASDFRARVAELVRHFEQRRPKAKKEERQ